MSQRGGCGRAKNTGWSTGECGHISLTQATEGDPAWCLVGGKGDGPTDMPLPGDRWGQSAVEGLHLEAMGNPPPRRFLKQQRGRRPPTARARPVRRRWATARVRGAPTHHR